MDPNDVPRRYLKYIIKIEWFFQSNIRQYPPKTSRTRAGQPGQGGRTFWKHDACLPPPRVRTRDSSGALQPLKPSAQFWVIAQIRRLLKIPTLYIDNCTVLVFSSSRNRLSSSHPAENCFMLSSVSNTYIPKSRSQQVRRSRCTASCSTSPTITRAEKHR